MDLHNTSRLGPLSGVTLNTEEISGLESAMQERLLSEHLSGKMQFWGKIFGSQIDDYLIVSNVDPQADFPEKKYWWCTTSDYKLRAMPINTDDYETIAKKISTRFRGEPSYFAYNGEEESEPEPEEGAAPVERFREMNRLAYIVKKIERDCVIVPRGALVVDAGKKVIANKYFEGLSHQTAIETRAYSHMRKPEGLEGLAMMKRPGIIKSGDFLDCINRDAPKELWSIQYNSMNTMAYVRNLYWEGYSFYSVINTSEYGGAYFGTGVPNYDIAFML